MPVREELLPCPFCGSEDVERHPDFGAVMLCNNCEAQGPRISFGSPNTPRQCWNTRAAPPSVSTDYCGWVDADPIGEEAIEQIISAWAFAHNIDGAARNDLFARLRRKAIVAASPKEPS